jgi:CRISPR-associated protein Cst2
LLKEAIMTLHLFATVVTPFGTAANNRAETEGNITTLQKIMWQGEQHSTVSAEAIRFALRRIWQEMGAKLNRIWNEEKRQNDWKDLKFEQWSKEDGEVFLDDDLLGFMSAEAAREEAEDTAEPSQGKKKGKARGTATVRRAVLEVTRAVSLTPWPGDFTFNAASPGATPAAQKQGMFPVPYGTEVHATRYQFSLALTPQRLRRPEHALRAVEAIACLRTVAGNHARFLYDFAPESIVFRLTHDPAPRMLYCFQTSDDGKSVDVPVLLQRVQAGDIQADELILGGPVTDAPSAAALKDKGATLFPGVLEACRAVQDALKRQLQLKE